MSGKSQKQAGDAANDQFVYRGVVGAGVPPPATSFTANSQNAALATNDVYQNQGKTEFTYGRQNSDQTAYVRNMRSVLHHNGLQNQNNFTGIGTQ